MRVICEKHGPPNSDDYAAELEPGGYPNNTVVLCGYSNYKNPGKMYLTEKEYKQNKHTRKTTFPAENDCLVEGKSSKASPLPRKTVPQNQSDLDDFTP